MLAEQGIPDSSEKQITQQGIELSNKTLPPHIAF
jgi:hypothetical protein